MSSLESYRDAVSIRLEGMLRQIADMTKNNRITATVVDENGRVIPGTNVESVGARQIELNAYRHAYEYAARILNEELKKAVDPGSVQQEDDRPEQPQDENERVY